MSNWKWFVKVRTGHTFCNAISAFLPLRFLQNRYIKKPSALLIRLLEAKAARYISKEIDIPCIHEIRIDEMANGYAVFNMCWFAEAVGKALFCYSFGGGGIRHSEVWIPWV